MDFAASAIDLGIRLSNASDPFYLKMGERAMPMDRERLNTSEASADLLSLVQELEEDHRVSMMIDRRDGEAKEWDDAKIDAEIDKRGENSTRLMRIITNFRSKRIADVYLKAYATTLIVDLHGDGNSFDEAIAEADTYESAALSTVRDMLALVA